jgi:hypothetical protein
MPRLRVRPDKFLVLIWVADHRHQELKPRQLESLESIRYRAVSFFKAGVLRVKSACFHMHLNKWTQNKAMVNLSTLSVEGLHHMKKANEAVAGPRDCIASDFSKETAMLATHVDGCTLLRRRSKSRRCNNRQSRTVSLQLRYPVR